MGPDNVLTSINQTEEKARQIEGQAQKLAQKILEDARQKVSRLEQEITEKLNIRVKSIIKKGEQDNLELAEKIKSQGETERRQLEKKLGPKISRTVQLILKEFKKNYGAS